MFGFFVDGEFKGMWGNKVGDIFYNNTVQKLRWDITKTVLVYYPDHREKRGSFEYTYTLQKVIEKEVIKDEQGNILSEAITNEINSELFAENGLLHKAC